MFLLGIPIAILTFGIGIVFTWVGSIIWAVVAANNANRNAANGLNISNAFGAPPQPQPQPSHAFTQPIIQDSPTVDLKSATIEKPVTPSPLVADVPIDGKTEPLLSSTPAYSERALPPTQPDPMVSFQSNAMRSGIPLQVAESSVAQKGEHSLQVSKPFKPLNTFSNWVSSNGRALVIVGAAIVLLLTLSVAVKYVYTLQFDKPTTSTNVAKTPNTSASVVTQTTATKTPAISALTYYTGQVGGFPVHMMLKPAGNYLCTEGGTILNGYYYYDRKGPGNKITVKGFTCGSNIDLTEYSGGKQTGFFRGKLVDRELHGEWTNGKSRRRFTLK